MSSTSRAFLFSVYSAAPSGTGFIFQSRDQRACRFGIRHERSQTLSLRSMTILPFTGGQSAIAPANSHGEWECHWNTMERKGWTSASNTSKCLRHTTICCFRRWLRAAICRTSKLNRNSYHKHVDSRKYTLSGCFYWSAMQMWKIDFYNDTATPHTDELDRTEFGLWVS